MRYIKQNINISKIVQPTVYYNKWLRYVKAAMWRVWYRYTYTYSNWTDVNDHFVAE